MAKRLRLFGRDQKLPGAPCLNCGDVLDGATALGGGNKPRPGDCTVCIECGHVMAFDAQLGFRELTGDEIKQIAGDWRLLAIQWGRGRVEGVLSGAPPPAVRSKLAELMGSAAIRKRR